MKNSENLANAVKKDLEALAKQLSSHTKAFNNKFDSFAEAIALDMCVKQEKCNLDKKTCEMNKSLDRILKNLDSYYTNIK